MSLDQIGPFAVGVAASVAAGLAVANMTRRRREREKENPPATLPNDILELLTPRMLKDLCFAKRPSVAQLAEMTLSNRAMQPGMLREAIEVLKTAATPRESPRLEQCVTALRMCCPNPDFQLRFVETGVVYGLINCVKSSHATVPDNAVMALAMLVQSVTQMNNGVVVGDWVARAIASDQDCVVALIRCMDTDQIRARGAIGIMGKVAMLGDEVNNTLVSAGLVQVLLSTLGPVPRVIKTGPIALWNIGDERMPTLMTLLLLLRHNMPDVSVLTEGAHQLRSDVLPYFLDRDALRLLTSCYTRPACQVALFSIIHALSFADEGRVMVADNTILQQLLYCIQGADPVTLCYIYSTIPQLCFCEVGERWRYVESANDLPNPVALRIVEMGLLDLMLPKAFESTDVSLVFLEITLLSHLLLVDRTRKIIARSGIMGKLIKQLDRQPAGTSVDDQNTHNVTMMSLWRALVCYNITIQEFVEWNLAPYVAKALSDESVEIQRGAVSMLWTLTSERLFKDGFAILESNDIPDKCISVLKAFMEQRNAAVNDIYDSLVFALVTWAQINPSLAEDFWPVATKLTKLVATGERNAWWDLVGALCCVAPLRVGAIFHDKDDLTALIKTLCKPTGLQAMNATSLLYSAMLLGAILNDDTAGSMLIPAWMWNALAGCPDTRAIQQLMLMLARHPKHRKLALSEFVSVGLLRYALVQLGQPSTVESDFMQTEGVLSIGHHIADPVPGAPPPIRRVELEAGAVRPTPYCFVSQSRVRACNVNIVVFETVRANACVTGAGRYYFEVELLTNMSMMIGWVAEGCDLTPPQTIGNSHEGLSYAICGGRVIKGKTTDVTTLITYAPGSVPLWSQGDIVGCEIDLDDGSVSFSINGKRWARAFTNVDRTRKWFPAVSLGAFQTVRFNFGSYAFSHAPSGVTRMSDVAPVPIAHAPAYGPMPPPLAAPAAADVAAAPAPSTAPAEVVATTVPADTPAAPSVAPSGVSTESAPTSTVAATAEGTPAPPPSPAPVPAAAVVPRTEIKRNVQSTDVPEMQLIFYYECRFSVIAQPGSIWRFGYSNAPTPDTRNGRYITIETLPSADAKPQTEAAFTTVAGDTWGTGILGSPDGVQMVIFTKNGKLMHHRIQGAPWEELSLLIVTTSEHDRLTLYIPGRSRLEWLVAQQAVSQQLVQNGNS